LAAHGDGGEWRGARIDDVLGRDVSGLEFEEAHRGILSGAQARRRLIEPPGRLLHGEDWRGLLLGGLQGKTMFDLKKYRRVFTTCKNLEFSENFSFTLENQGFL